MPSTPRVLRLRPADPARWRAMFFLNVMLRRSKNRQSTLGAKPSPCVLNRWSASSASVTSGVASTRARISPAWLSIRAERRSPPCTAAFASPLADQFDRRRRRHTEPAGRASTAHSLNFHCPNDAKTKIRRKRFGHAGWPPIPAPMKNHDLPRKGIPPIPKDRKML